MYFKEKEDTNIDSQFESSKKISFDFKNLKLKPLLLVGGGIILLIVIILIISALMDNSNKTVYTIQLYGDEKITISLGNEYVEPGYAIYDNYSNIIQEQAEIISNVDTSKAGKYEITYSIGNTSKVRYVTVAETENKTYIRLKGKINMYLEVGETYKEPGYEVYDSENQNLTSKVSVNGTVDTSKVGAYQITYSVVNSKNITTAVKRTVIVVEKGQKPQE